MSKAVKKDQLIMLWDIRPEDFESLLTFMYEGAVNVNQEELNSLMEAAGKLQVRGLTKFGEPSNSSKKGAKKRKEGAGKSGGSGGAENGAAGKKMKNDEIVLSEPYEIASFEDDPPAEGGEMVIEEQTASTSTYPMVEDISGESPDKVSEKGITLLQL